MNLGFYVNSTAPSEQNNEIFNMLNAAMENNELVDASVFYNDIDYNPVKLNFGLFNATELWSFTGVLICDTLENAYKATNIINKFKPLYIYNKLEKNILRLLDISDKVKILARTKEDADEMYRVTGKKPHLINKLSPQSITEVL